MFKSTLKNTRVPVNLSPELHRQLKIISKKQAMPISTVIKQQIEASLNLPKQSPSIPEFSSIQDLLTAILRKSIRMTALFDHFLVKDLTQQEVAVLEEFCTDEFKRLTEVKD